MFQNRSVTKSQSKYLNRSVIRFQSKVVKTFPSRNVEMFLDSLAPRFQSKSVPKYLNRNVGMFQDRTVKTFPNNNVPRFPSRTVQRSIFVLCVSSLHTAEEYQIRYTISNSCSENNVKISTYHKHDIVYLIFIIIYLNKYVN